MPGEVMWDNEEKTVIRQVFSGVVKEEDYYHVIEMTYHMIRSVDHTVHIINDRDTVTSRPQGLLRVFRYANRRMATNQGLLVIANAGYFLETVVELAQIVAPKLLKNVYYASNLDEARHIIRVKGVQSVGI